MFQNCFVLLAGSGRLRVATYGFVGSPAKGDRPDRKSTPFCLRLLSPDILSDLQGVRVEDAATTMEAASKAENIAFAVRCAWLELHLPRSHL